MQYIYVVELIDSEGEGEFVGPFLRGLDARRFAARHSNAEVRSVLSPRLGDGVQEAAAYLNHYVVKED